MLFHRLLKTLGYTIAGVVLLVLSALALFQLASQETRRDLLIGAVGAATGGTLQVGAPFRLELARELLLEVAGLQLQSPDGKPWFDAQKVRLRFPLLPLLLHRRLELTLHLEKSRLYLGKEEAGEQGISLPFTPVPVEISLSKLEVLQFADDEDGKARPLASLDHALLREKQGEMLLDLKGNYSGLPLQMKTVFSTEEPHPPVTIYIAGPGMELNGKGRFQVNQARWRVEMEIDGSARDLARIGKLLEVELNPVEPVRTRARLVLEPEHLLLQQFQFSAGGNDLGGNLAFSRPKNGKLRVEGSLESRALDLSRLVPRKRAMEVRLVDKGEEVPLRELKKAVQEQLFTETPIRLGWLGTVDARIRFRLGELRSHGILLKRLEGNLRLSQRNLDLAVEKGFGGGRPVEGELHLSSVEKPAKWSLGLKLDDADIATLLPGFELQPASGTLSLNLNLRSRGNTPAAIFAGLEGNETLLVRDTSFTFDQPNELGRSLLSRLDPASYKKGRDRIECAALYVEFGDGMARTPRKIAVQFPEVTWLGDGVLELKTERISLKMTPHSRTGLGLSLKGIADLIAVSGTLSRPYIIIDPSGALLTSLSWTAAAATGGTSLLIQGLLERNLVSGDVCGRIVSGEKPGKKAAAAKSGNKTKKISNLDILDQE